MTTRYRSAPQPGHQRRWRPSGNGCPRPAWPRSTKQATSSMDSLVAGSPLPGSQSNVRWASRLTGQRRDSPSVAACSTAWVHSRANAPIFRKTAPRSARLTPVSGLVSEWQEITVLWRPIGVPGPRVTGPVKTCKRREPLGSSTATPNEADACHLIGSGRAVQSTVAPARVSGMIIRARHRAARTAPADPA
jgi:hypothetical protein